MKSSPRPRNSESPFRVGAGRGRVPPTVSRPSRASEGPASFKLLPVRHAIGRTEVLRVLIPLTFCDALGSECDPMSSTPLVGMLSGCRLLFFSSESNQFFLLFFLGKLFPDRQGICDATRPRPRARAPPPTSEAVYVRTRQVDSNVDPDDVVRGRGTNRKDK